MSFKQQLKNLLPASVFHVLRDVPWIVKGMTRKAPQGVGPIPPLHLMFDGPRDYEQFLRTGQETLDFYKNWASMKPTDAVLDIGCGIGRKTLPLLGYLTSQALYVGMEIDRRGVDWLLRHVTSQNQRFVFLQQDIYSRFYNSKGALDPGKLVLPFPDGSFDMVVLWSVFTHMYPNDIAHYLSEIARVLRPGGKLAASYYLYNESVIDRMARSETTINFAYPLTGSRTTNPNIPEDAMAVEDSWLRGVLGEVRLMPERVMYGAWSGHAAAEGLPTINFQDIVLARKS